MLKDSMNRLLVRPIGSDVLEAWDDLVSASDTGSVFHTNAWLLAVERTRDTQLLRLGAYLDDELVGILPVFRERRRGIRLISTPPPRTAIPWLGPLRRSQPEESGRAAEAAWLELTRGLAHFLTAEIDADAISVKGVLPFGSSRGFTWEGFEAFPSFTYEIDLSRTAEDIQRSFSSNVRRNIRRCEKRGYEFHPATDDDVLRIYRHIVARYKEQGRPSPYSQEYLERLWTTVDRKHLTGFVVRDGSEYLTGMLCTVFKGRVSFWSGLPRVVKDRAFVNDFFHWHLMLWAKARGCSTYDMVGANTALIARYKSKFAPRLVPYYRLVSDTWKGRLARWTYGRVRSRLSRP